MIYGMPYEKWKGKFQLNRNSQDIEKVMKMIKDKEVKFVDLRFTDTKGKK